MALFLSALPVQSLEVSSSSSNVTQTDTLLHELTLLKKFISQVATPHLSWKTPESASVCSQWAGVSCDASGFVTRLSWSGLKLTGNLSWSYLPSRVTELYMWKNALRGSITLPPTNTVLREVNLKLNEFTGPLDLTALPESLEVLSVRRNALSGNCDLHFLPPEMRSLALSHNQFQSGIYLNLLPPVLSFLYVDNNELGTTVCLTQLPERLTNLHLQQNYLIGVADLRRLPRSLTSTHLENNCFHAVEYEKTGAKKKLDDAIVFNPQRSGIILHSGRSDSCTVC